MGMLINPYAFAAASGSAAAYQAEVLADSPWAYYKMDEASGTTLVDSSGNGRNATLSGSAAGYRAAGISSAPDDVAMSLAGQFFSVGYDTALTGGDITFELWLYPTNLARNTPKGLFDFNNESAMLRISDGGGREFGILQSKVPSSFTQQTPQVFEANYTPIHFVWAQNGTTGAVNIYKNGRLVETATQSPSTAWAVSNGTLKYPWNSGNGREIHGRHAHVALYKSQLSAARVLAHYQALGGVPPVSGYVFYDRFERADSTSGLGVSDSGHTWLLDGGTWGIDSGMARTVSVTNDAFAYWDTGSNDHEVEWTFGEHAGAAQDLGIDIRRQTLNNRYWIDTFGENLRFIKVVGGSLTVINGAITSFPPGSRGKVRVQGSTFTFWKNGTQVAQITDSSLATGTKVGMASHTGNGNYKWGEFLANPL